MKVTKRQLRGIIKEAIAADSEEVTDYHDWARDHGHITPAASSVMASYFIDRGVEDDHELHQRLSSAIGLKHDDVMREMDRQSGELKLSAPTSATVKRLKQGLRRQKRPRTSGDFRHWRDRWEV